jgi:D-cysteine desulfhydrase
LPEVPPAEIAIDDRAVGPGYAEATDEGLEIIRGAAREDGVLLDPVYTGKALLGLARRAGEPGALASRRVVLLHSGGAFGAFPFAARLVP